MGAFSTEVLYKLDSSDPVASLYFCVASTLGFDTKMEAGDSLTSGSQNQTFGCVNSTCSINPCSSLYMDFGAVFASISYLLFLVSTIQLILVMVHDALQEDKHSRWQKAFRVTIQKCLLGAVILATGSRAIYYTVQSIIPDRWGDILLNVYYPSLLSAVSLIICFWAEFFYTSSNLEGQDQGQDFLKKHRYSLTYLVFNVMVYLLLLADIIATPLISEQEQIQMSGIVGTIFAFFLFVTLVGFLHFAIRLFFRPDWQPLFVQLAVLRINLRQQLASVLGVVSNALMQSLIICLLVFNMVVRYIPVDSYSLYVCAVIIRVTELIMPVWFCCSLWNFKQPRQLWILNPGLILRRREQVGEDVESKPLLSDSSPHTQYGAITVVEGDDPSTQSSSDDGCCWVCLGNDDPSDLFYPCNCQLHRKCIKQWVAKRASDPSLPEKEYMRCQVCRKKYRVKKDGFMCCYRGMRRRQWLQLMTAGAVVMCSVVGLVLFGMYSKLETNRKILVICCVAIFEAVVFKVLAVRMALILRKANHGRLDIQGYSVADYKRRKEEQRKRREAKKKLLDHAYRATPPPSAHVRASSSVGEVLVHYNHTGSEGSVTVETGGEEHTHASIAIIDTVSVEVSAS